MTFNFDIIKFKTNDKQRETGNLVNVSMPWGAEQNLGYMVRAIDCCLWLRV